MEILRDTIAKTIFLVVEREGGKLEKKIIFGCIEKSIPIRPKSTKIAHKSILNILKSIQNSRYPYFSTLYKICPRFSWYLLKISKNCSLRLL